MDIRRFTFYCLVLAGVSLFTAKAVQASIGVSAADPSFLERYIFNVFLPEGWGFFTKNPRHEKVVLYRVLPDKSLEVATYRNASASNLFGLSRRGRRISVEFSRVAPELQPRHWQRFESYSLPTLLATDSIAPIVVSARQYDLRLLTKGNYIVKRYNLIPWAWAQYPEHYTNPEHFLKLTIN